MSESVQIVNDDAVIRYARRYVEANMTAKVTITRMAEPYFDADGKLQATEMYVIYEGKARVYGVSGPVTMNLGEEPQYFSSTYVSIPIDSTQPRVDDVIEVTSHHDWTMVGRTFRVMDVEAGGQYPSVRRMQVTGIQRSKQWGSPASPKHPTSTDFDIPEEWKV